MKIFFGMLLCAGVALSIAAAQPVSEQEVIGDAHFQRGFILWKPEPGSHVKYGELKGWEKSAAPVWGLDQWSSKYPLSEAGTRADGVLIYSNAAKSVTLGAREASDLILAANAGAEYGTRARRSPSEPWVHLLVEQEFERPPFLKDLRRANFHVEARLLHSRLVQEKNYTPDLHAAQFTIFFTVQNRNRNSAGFGDLVWFGVPIYDNRSRFPKAFKEQDFGGTAKFIFTPDGREFTTTSAQDGGWVVIDRDLLPLMMEALNTAWSRGFLRGSKDFADYAIGGMNLGWELPGIFDVSMQVRNLSLRVQRMK